MLRDASVCCIRSCNSLKAGSRPGEGYFVAVLLLLPEHFEYCIPCLIELHISEEEKKKKWGPYFESDGDLMGTFASRNGDPKSLLLRLIETS